MKLRVFGIRLEVCWDEEPDTGSIQDPVWAKNAGKDEQKSAYEGIETRARRTGLYL